MNAKKSSLASFFIFTLSCLNYFKHTQCYDFIDISNLGYEQYQDIIINNVVVKPASTVVNLHNGSIKVNHDCESRYQIIQSFLNNYKRPFTLLDVGASQGYYSFRTAHDYNSVCVMIDGNNRAYPYTGTQLEQLCALNNLDNVILLKKSIFIEDLQKLGECEHFDVILALNIIHWFKSQWKEITDALLSLGDNIIIETPPSENPEHKFTNIELYLQSKGAEIIGQVKRHTSATMVNIYLVKTNKSSLLRKTWIYRHQTPEKYTIVSNFNEKKIIKNNINKITNWEPGINLITFKMYSGAYPTINMLKNSLSNLRTIETNDWMPNNMIVQGKNLLMIDRDELRPPKFIFSETRYNMILEWLSLDKPQDVESFFWKLARIRRSHIKDLGEINKSKTFIQPKQ